MRLGLLMMLIFLGVLIAGSIYLSKKIATYFTLSHYRYRYLVVLLVIVIMFYCTMGTSGMSHPVSSVAFAIASVCLGVILYFMFASLIFDGVRVFVPMSARLHGILSLSCALLVVLYGIINANSIQLFQQTIPVEGLTDEVRIIHLSDTHLGHLRGQNYLERIVTLIMQQKVDYVFITGDLFDAKAALHPKTLAPLKKLSVPIYFVEGNHDLEVDIRTITRYLRDIEVHVLENELVDVGSVQVVGLQHMRADASTYDFHAQGGATIKSVLELLSIDADKPSILLHHSPDGAKYAYEQGIDLFLAGHTHGGQFFPITRITELMFPYNNGLYKHKTMSIYTSQGAGTGYIPMRVGTKSEITVITLIPK